MSLHTALTLVEAKWLDKLSLECQRIFQNHHIPSHDFEHHNRVWQNLKLLITNLVNTGQSFDEKTIESLIIACFFHDTGLTRTLDEKHGSASRDLCQAYFESNLASRPGNLNEILYIIENHENKNYPSGNC